MQKIQNVFSRRSIIGNSKKLFGLFLLFGILSCTSVKKAQSIDKVLPLENNLSTSFNGTFANKFETNSHEIFSLWSVIDYKGKTMKEWDELVV